MAEFTILSGYSETRKASFSIALAPAGWEPAPFEGWEITGGGPDGPQFSHAGRPVERRRALGALRREGCNMSALREYVVRAHTD